CRPPSSGLASALHCRDPDVGGNGSVCASWLLEAHSPGPSRRPRPARPRPPSLVSTAGPTGPNGRGSTRSIGPTGSNIRSAGSNGRDWDRAWIEIEGEILSETTREYANFAAS